MENYKGDNLETFVICLIGLLPLFSYWRFKDARLDRDWGAYAYNSVFKCFPFTNGARDVKPFLTHGVIWAWRKLPFISKLTLARSLRLLVAVVFCLVALIVGVLDSPLQALVFVCLVMSPYLWGTHMAQTEFLTVAVVSFVMAFATLTDGTILPWLVLGLLPLVNQKNLLLIAPVAWALGLSLTPIIPNALAILAPSLAFAAWLLLTGRWSMAKLWLWTIPKRMGKKRSFKANTVSVLHLLIPFFYKLALILCIVDYTSPWFVVLLVVMAMTISVKQVVPHHFILWALPLAMCADPTPLFFAGFVILWFLQDYTIWRHPQLLYPITFRFRNSGGVKDYGMLLSDADEAIDWVKAHTEPGEAILVNGIENSFYLDADRPASAMQICEAQNEEEPILPRVIVHSAATAKEIDMTGYEHVLITPMGLYSVFKRKDLKL